MHSINFFWGLKTFIDYQTNWKFKLITGGGLQQFSGIGVGVYKKNALNGWFTKNRGGGGIEGPKDQYP